MKTRDELLQMNVAQVANYKAALWADGENMRRKCALLVLEGNKGQDVEFKGVTIRCTGDAIMASGVYVWVNDRTFVDHLGQIHVPGPWEQVVDELYAVHECAKAAARIAKDEAERMAIIDALAPKETKC